MSMKNQTVLTERVVDAPAKRVWKAISTVDELLQWSLHFPGFPGPSIVMPGSHEYKVLEMIPGRKLAFSWCHNRHPGGSVVTYRLAPMGPQTLVQITHEGIETLTHELDREDIIKGWNSIVDALQKFTETETVYSI
jgi:uncharacterized protein YndB with AHSA1/START domain